MTRQQTYLLCQFAGWGLHALANITFATAFGQTNPKMVWVYAAAALVGVAVSHQLRQVIRQQRWLDLSLGRLVPRLAAGTLAGGLTLSTAVGLVMLWPIQLMPPRSWNWLMWSASVSIWSTTLLLWLMIYLGIHYFERLRRAEIDQVRLEVAAKDAQLRSLLAQVNPHFLFNSLNSLRALIVEDPTRAQTMVTELAEILRYSLKADSADTVQLAAEVEAVQTYLKLEAIRLEDRLRVKLNIAPGVLDMQVPPMLVQTLVENAVKHGISRRSAGGEISIHAAEANGTLHVEVVNSGQLATSGDTQLGLKNVRERLRLLFGEQAKLTLRNLDPDNVIAEVVIPHARPAH